MYLRACFLAWKMDRIVSWIHLRCLLLQLNDPSGRGSWYLVILKHLDYSVPTSQYVYSILVVLWLLDHYRARLILLGCTAHLHRWYNDKNPGEGPEGKLENKHIESCWSGNRDNKRERNFHSAPFLLASTEYQTPPADPHGPEDVQDICRSNPALQ